MQPVKLTIPGSYWDSFIYKGHLYLFGVDGDVKSLAWESLVEDVAAPHADKIALSCAFLRSDYLYQSDVQILLKDPEIKDVVKRKFKRLAKLDLAITDRYLSRHEKGWQDNPCPFPHADLEIYNDKLYVASTSGVFQASCNKRTKYPISTRPKQLWDAPVLGVSASYGSVALAAGSEGLYELEIDSAFHSNSTDPSQLAGIACRDCGWAYYSVFASSDGSGYMAEFTKQRRVEGDGLFKEEHDRIFSSLDSATEIFGFDGYSWGVQDKLCQAVPGEIRIVKYEPWAEFPEDRITRLGSVPLAPWKGEVVAAGTASFGVVVELENALVVLPSNGSVITLPGEPVNWRVFPRSRRYENQLHVIYDDRLEVLSFNQDYLVDQEQKLLGTSVFSRKSARGGFDKFVGFL